MHRLFPLVYLFLLVPKSYFRNYYSFVLKYYNFTVLDIW